MPPRHTDASRNACDLYGIQPGEVELAWSVPEAQEELVHEGARIALAIGARGSDEKLLILSWVNPQYGLSEYLFALRIRGELLPRINGFSPLFMLELFCQQFGFPIRVGTRVSRIVMHETIDAGQGLNPVFPTGDIPRHTTQFFVRSRLDGARQVLDCLLAFCLDDERYLAWLSGRPPAESHPPREPSPLRFLPADTASWLANRTQSDSDVGRRHNLRELLIAMRIIEALMGKEWFERIVVSRDPITDAIYRRLVRSHQAHPANRRFRSGQPRDYVRLILLGQILNALWMPNDENGLGEKIKELRTLTFEQTFFELRIAGHFLRQGLDVSFVPRGISKTPDLRVASPDGGIVFVECKSKTEPGLQIDNAIANASEQLSGAFLPGLILVELQQTPSDVEMESLVVRATQLLELSVNVEMVAFAFEEPREQLGTLSAGLRVFGRTFGRSAVSVSERLRQTCTFQVPVHWTPLQVLLQGIAPPSR